MAIEDKLKPKSTVSFDVYPVAILGVGYSNVKILGLVDASTARALNFDPDAMHVNVYPTLPAGVPNNASEYMYIRIQLENGATTIVGLPWIKEETIQLIAFTTGTFIIPQIGPEDLPKIVKLLAAGGYNVSETRLT